ncbi:armadillo-type protein [Melampsora americana]|nr:armadillo-type protein [Melampsora americana]
MSIPTLLSSNSSPKPLQQPSNFAAPRKMSVADPIGSERWGMNMNQGLFSKPSQSNTPTDRPSSLNIQSNLANSQSSHSVGVIGSSRPGSRVDQTHLASGASQVPQQSTLHVPTTGMAKERENADHPVEQVFNSSNVSAGYTLSSSMWATPTSCTPPTRLHNFNKNTIAHRPNLASLNVSEANRDEGGIPQVSPLDQSASCDPLRQSTDQSDLSKHDSTPSFDSPELSFSQTPSASSTARSLVAGDSATRTPLSSYFNPDCENGEHYGLGFKRPYYANSPAQGFGKENTHQMWPLPLSFGEEAFYSKSNVTKTQNSATGNFAAPRREASPGLWKLASPSHRPSATGSSPPNPGPQSALGSPFLAPQYITDFMNAMSTRVEQLERALAAQDLAITHLKANLNLPAGPTVPLKNPLPNNVVNNAFPLMQNGRSLNQGGQQPPLNVNAGQNGSGPPLGPAPVSAGHPLQPHRMNTANTPPGNFSEYMSNLNGNFPYSKAPGFGPRQLGPLDFAMGRTNSFAGTAPILNQPHPTSIPVPTSALPGGLGGVNYRALLAGDADCDYEYFIRRITEHNDQQSSIFLQQKLKQSAVASSTGFDAAPNLSSDSHAPREEITRLVIHYSLELMSNRFGNFLVSRAIEHATPEERMQMAESIRGHIIPLASDTFATHCLQKMIDVDEEDNNQIRWLISQELLKKKETVTHKSAGHVWARLLSVGGSSSAMHLHVSGLNVKKPNGLNQYGSGVGSPGELERNLNELLKGQWAKTAKDEVGSLIVQSVLENWSEAEKTDVIEELLAEIYSCAVQQWGNFVILHLIEHSSGETQKRLFDRLTETQLACELSIDNFGAKAIEKVMKVSGMDSPIVESYVRGICEYGHGRPALIEIACHQAGAQVLTLLFTSAPNPIRELMIQTVRRNGVTMKSSKAGSKIWFLVERTRAWVGH